MQIFLTTIFLKANGDIDYNRCKRPERSYYEEFIGITG
jgi:hypothetical protein